MERRSSPSGAQTEGWIPWGRSDGYALCGRNRSSADYPRRNAAFRPRAEGHADERFTGRGGAVRRQRPRHVDGRNAGCQLVDAGHQCAGRNSGSHFSAGSKRNFIEHKSGHPMLNINKKICRPHRKSSFLSFEAAFSCGKAL